jgi:putative hydrolase of the HAD superfamily
MIKVVCFDLDGVVLKKRNSFFSDKLSEKLGIGLDKILPFFKNEYKQIVIGKADLKESLEKYFSLWGWTGTVDELVGFWFTSENNIDEEVLEIVKKIKEKSFKTYLASDHSKERAENLLKVVGLEKYFDGDFFSGNVGYTKEEKEFFEKMVENLGVNSEEVLFIDDDMKNVEVAKSAGLNAIYFENVEQLKNSLQTFVL